MPKTKLQDAVFTALMATLMSMGWSSTTFPWTWAA